MVSSAWRTALFVFLALLVGGGAGAGIDAGVSGTRTTTTTTTETSTTTETATTTVTTESAGPRAGQMETTQIEDGLRRQVEEQNPGTRVVSVRCPGQVPMRKGYSFSCHVLGSKPGQESDAKVTETDDQGDVHFNVP